MNASQAVHFITPRLARPGHADELFSVPSQSKIPRSNVAVLTIERTQHGDHHYGRWTR